MLTTQSLKVNLNINTFHSFDNLLILKVSGTDATRYLHGRLTQNIKALNLNQIAQSLILNPQGRIQGKFFILKKDSFYLLISDPLSSKEAEDELVKNILQFKVADDVSIENISSSLKAFYCFENNNNKVTQKIMLQNDNEINNFKEISLEEFEAVRIINKIPRMELDIDEKTIASEIEIENLISFNKGCYVGQEVVEMSTARGRPNRKLILLGANSSMQILSNEEIFSINDNKSCGITKSSFFLKEENKIYCLGFVKYNLAEEKKFKTTSLELEQVDSLFL